MKRITGHLEERNGKYYAAVNLYTAEGKRKVKWYGLDLLTKKGNKKEAMRRLNELLEKINAGNNFLADTMTPAERERNRLAQAYVEDYLPEWLEGHRRNITDVTYRAYKLYIDRKIKPFFSPMHLRLQDVTGDEINMFYASLAKEGLKGTTMQRYHAMLHLAFKTAMKRRIIPSNPVDQAERPKAEQYIADYLTVDEMRTLLEKSQDDDLHLIIQLACFYGLRRSEILGIKWSAINFGDDDGENGFITIRHKILEKEGGELEGYDVMKTKSSYRTMPLLPNIREALLREKEQQEHMRIVLGNGYCQDYLEYVNVDAVGRLYRPSYVTSHFKTLQIQLGMEPVRFHDLRHSCASAMLAIGKSMKEIQIWLGHSNMSTTANIYSHLDSRSKVNTGEAIFKALTE